MAQNAPSTDESPYTIPTVLLVTGVLIGGVLALIEATGDEVPNGMALAAYGLAGLVVFIGATAVAVLLGTEPLRRRR